MLRTIGKWTILLLLLVQGTGHAGLTSTVERTIVTDLDLIVLTVRATDEDFDTKIDFSPLNKDFDLINQSSRENRSISIVNGQTTNVSYKDHVFTLRPRRVGEIIIPALKGGDKATRPIRVKVTAQTNSQIQRMRELVFFETSVDKNSVFVQEQILYSVKLFYSESIRGDFPNPPSLENTIVENVEEENRYESIINGKRYYVLEKKYALFPQSSGKLLIPKESFIGTYGLGGVFSGRQRISATSKQHEVSIKPVPSSFSGQHWIPAEKLEVEDFWDKDGAELIEGEPINRKIEISAKGIDEAMLPEISDEGLSGFKVYADPPINNRIIDSEGISTVSTKIIAMIPTRSGKIVVPELEIPWWNVLTNKEEIAVIPQKVFQVVSPKGSVIDNTAGKLKNSPLLPDPQKATESEVNSYWFWTTLALLGVWAFTFLKLLSSNKRLAFEREKNGSSNEFKKELESTSDRIFSLLKTACTENNAEEANKLLIEWRDKNFPGSRSMDQISNQFPDLGNEIRKLDSFLYSAEGERAWDGSKLLKELAIINSKKLNTRLHIDGKLETALNPG